MITKKRRIINNKKTQQNKNIFSMCLYLFIPAELGILDKDFKWKTQYQKIHIDNETKMLVIMKTRGVEWTNLFCCMISIGGVVMMCDETYRFIFVWRYSKFSCTNENEFHYRANHTSPHTKYISNCILEHFNNLRHVLL